MSPIPRKINLENIKSICYNPRENFFHTMCNFLCQALKIQISFIFLLSISAPGALCEPIHQTPKVDKTSTSEKFKYSRGRKNHQERKSLQPAFLWFHKFPRLQSFCRKEVRRGSLWWEQERRRSIMYFKPIFF